MGTKAKISRKKMIDYSSPLPYYYQLKKLLVTEIEKGRIKTGEQIPSEYELCEQFKISRTVVRQAISSLVNSGYLQREKGKGTFVTRPKITENLFQNLTGAYEDMLAQGVKLETKVLEQKKQVAGKEVAENLGLEPKDMVIRIKRLRFVNDEPFSLATTYIPYEVCPARLEENLANQSLYQVLEEKYSIKIINGRRSLEAVSADAQVAKLLGVKEGTPLMLLNSISYKEDGRPIEFFYAYHRGDRSKFVVSLMRVRNRGGENIDNNFIPGIKDTGLVSLKKEVGETRRRGR